MIFLLRCQGRDIKQHIFLPFESHWLPRKLLQGAFLAILIETWIQCRSLRLKLVAKKPRRGKIHQFASNMQMISLQFLKTCFSFYRIKNTGKNLHRKKECLEDNMVLYLFPSYCRCFRCQVFVAGLAIWSFYQQ